MCDICNSAKKELDVFLKELENRYPGSSIDGNPVPRGHHVEVAVLYKAVEIEQAVREEMALEQLFRTTPPTTH